MKIKSLLLGSTAALAVVSGAQAADAIVAAQPEPVDYVKVCDAFGTGYFYIPGTETCLKIGGMIREDLGFGDLNAQYSHSFDDPQFPRAANAKPGTFWHNRLELYTDTNANTELGVLHTYTNVRFDYYSQQPTYVSRGYQGAGNPNGTKATLKYAYIELGGFRVGKTESEFTRLAFYGNGYAGGVIDDTLVPYGPFDTQQISYTYKNSGFSAVIAAETDGGVGRDGAGDYVPSVLGGLAYNNGTFGGAVIGAYDDLTHQGAVKARVDGKFGKVSGFLMGGWSTNGSWSDGYEVPSNQFARWGGDWAVWGGLSADLAQKVSANLQLSYDDVKTFGAAGNLVFHVVPGFNVTTEVDYRHLENPIASYDQGSQWGGMVRFQRSF